jgi:hypothetical protein
MRTPKAIYKHASEPQIVTPTIKSPSDYNRDVPLAERQHMVAHELGHFYQAQRLVGVNLDVTFGYHYADSNDAVATRALIRAPDGKCIVQSRTHGAAFVDRLADLVACGILDDYTATRYSFCRILGGGQMEEALYGESRGDSDDLQLLRFRLRQTPLSESDQRILEDDIRTEVQRSLTPDVLQKVRCAVSVLVREHFNGQRTSGDVIHKIMEGCQHD